MSGHARGGSAGGNSPAEPDQTASATRAGTPEAEARSQTAAQTEMTRRRWLLPVAAVTAAAGLFAAGMNVGLLLMGVQRFPCEAAVAVLVVALLVLAVKKAS